MTLVLLDYFHPEISITHHSVHPLVIILSHLGKALTNSPLWKDPRALGEMGTEPGLPLPTPQQNESGMGVGVVVRESGGSEGGHRGQEEVDSPVRWPHTWLDP